MSTFTKLAISFTLLLCAFSAGFGQDREDPVIAVLKTPDRVHAVAFSPEDRFLAAGIGWGTQGGARIWSLPDRKVVADLASGSDDDSTVDAIAFSPDGKYFAMADWAGKVTIWDVKTWKLIKTAAKFQKDTETISFSPDSKQLLVTREQYLVLVNVDRGEAKVIESLPQKTSYIEAQFSNDGRQIVVSDNKTTRILDLASMREVKKWDVDSIFFGRASDDLKYLVTGGGAMFDKKILKIMDLNENKTVASFEGFRDGVYGLAFSQSKKTFALSGGGYGAGGFVSVWDTSTGRELGFASYGRFPIQGLAYSHDDKLLAAGSESDAVVLYDPEKLRGPEVERQDFSLCGEILREDGKVYIVPLTKVPHPRGPEDQMVFDWKLEIVNSSSIDDEAAAVNLKSWFLERGSVGDRVRASDLAIINRKKDASESIIFGEIQNPGWNKGKIVKLYSNGSYVVADNPGRCVATGMMERREADFSAMKKRLETGGFFGLKALPLTPQTPHFYSRFIAVRSNGTTTVRSDAEDIDKLFKKERPEKREAFNTVYAKEEPFLKSLIDQGPIDRQENR